MDMPEEVGEASGRFALDQDGCGGDEASIYDDGGPNEGEGGEELMARNDSRRHRPIPSRTIPGGGGC